MLIKGLCSIRFVLVLVGVLDCFPAGQNEDDDDHEHD
jgi:hypothetical protein